MSSLLPFYKIILHPLENQSILWMVEQVNIFIVLCIYPLYQQQQNTLYPLKVVAFAKKILNACDRFTAYNISKSFNLWLAWLR